MVRLAIGLFVTLSGIWAQDPSAPAQPLSLAPSGPASVAEKWHFFREETVNPLTLAGGAFNAAVSQATNSAPQYGPGAGAYAERVGASVADIVGLNFCVDFVMASAWKEDTRYVRKGPGHGIWSRAAWAISRAFVTRTDAGGPTVNWANLTGSALAGGVSLLYYPSSSRTASGVAERYAIGIGGGALTNLLPEFGPDVWRWIKRHHRAP